MDVLVFPEAKKFRQDVLIGDDDFQSAKTATRGARAHSNS